MWRHLKKYWLVVLLAPLFMLGEAGMDLLQPTLMAAIVDDGVLGLNRGGVGDMHLVVVTGLAMIGLVAFGGFCGVMSGVFANLAAQNFGNDVRKDAFSHIMHFSFAQTDRFTTGSLITRTTNDITQVQNMVQMTIRGYVINLKILPGQKIALVGATGSGKTTVVNLLMRFYQPDSGVIRINGTDIRQIHCGSLRDAIAIVLQDTVLFADTVRRNLKYADPDATDEEMIACAKESHVHSMVRHLEQGYDTVLAADGDNISQGQKQLLSIARAFVSKPQILILDEATSNVDTRTEKRIQDAMVRLMQGRTSLVIAHRLSTIQDADVIVVMEQGRIVEKGTHEELLAAGGTYHDLYMTQFAGRSI